MRPLLFGNDSTQELHGACQRLARVFRSAPQKVENPPRGNLANFELWWTLAIVTVMALGAVVLVASADFLADNLFAALRAAEQQRIEEAQNKEEAIRARYAPWIDAYPGQWYTIQWGKREIRIRSKGTLQKLSELPKEGNQIGDFWNIEGQENFWVWMIPDGGSAPAWVDP